MTAKMTLIKKKHKTTTRSAARNRKESALAAEKTPGQSDPLMNYEKRQGVFLLLEKLEPKIAEVEK